MASGTPSPTLTATLPSVSAPPDETEVGSWALLVLLCGAFLPELARAEALGKDVGGGLTIPDLFPAGLDAPLDVDPGWLARVAVRRVAAGERMPVEPLYLRRPDALTTAERGAS